MKNKRIIRFLLLGFVIVVAGALLSSCGAVSYLDSGTVSTDYEYYPAEEFAAQDSYEGEYSEAKRAEDGYSESSIRHVISNGSIDLAISDTRETMRKIREMVKDAEGIVSNSYIYEMREGQYGGYMTLRVPEKLFEPLMEQLETYGKATNVQTGIDDVTMQYVDLESRLKNQEAQEARLVEILDMAETVEEVLEVERELYRVRGEIEAMTAQFTYLKDQVTYATINVSLREETIPTENISQGAFENIGKRISQAFIGSINFILNAVSFIIIALSALLPVIIVLGVIVFLIILLIKKASRRKPAKEAESNEEIKAE